MRCKIAMIGLSALILSGCGTFKAPVVIKAEPPFELMQDCPIPEVDKRTNGGLAKGIQDLRGALVLCNNDKAALRERYKE